MTTEEGVGNGACQVRVAAWRNGLLAGEARTGATVLRPRDRGLGCSYQIQLSVWRYLFMLNAHAHSEGCPGRSVPWLSDVHWGKDGDVVPQRSTTESDHRAEGPPRPCASCLRLERRCVRSDVHCDRQGIR